MALSSAPHTVIDMVEAYYISIVMVMVPCVRILRRAGVSHFYAAFLLVPWFGVLFYTAALAFSKWPVLPPRPPRRKKGAAA